MIVCLFATEITPAAILLWLQVTIVFGYEEPLLRFRLSLLIDYTQRPVNVEDTSLLSFT